MSEQDQLPACALCGEPPNFSRLWKTARCETDGCAMRSVEMSEADWRRLMARPRLAPKHVEELRWLLRGATGGAVTLYPLEFDAIRAALAAMGEE